jgi:hypothetical protein
VLVLHVWLDILLCVLFQRCSLVEETCALLVLYGDLWITNAIDDSDNIPIGLHTVRHEAFEVGILHVVFLMRSLSSLHMIHWTFASSDCMSHTAMVMTLQYAASYM